MSFEAEALSIVEAVLALEVNAARTALIAARCGGDPALRARVEALLAWDNTDFRLTPTDSFVRPLAVIDTIPDAIGPYRVVGEIARGGMGAVVKGERADGVFHQVVAIKLIRGDLASPRAKARFAEERRILARLRHPGIVRILDGGEQDQRPWLAMDFIDGLPIDRALDRLDASESRRLDSFVAVCEAVAFAHRSLIIHADIKPSNVLMSADGGVHLLDFGIARLIAAIDTDEAGDPYPLTKSYAAPERGVGVAPTIATDVFSLGVLLLAILGKPFPRDAGDVVPGTRLPMGALDGDLAAIAGRALAEAPEDRYADVQALTADLGRYRTLWPVEARQGGDWRYPAGRFIRRNRRALTIAGAAVLALLATTAFTTVQYVRAERARVEADARFAELRQLARFMLGELSDRLSDAPGTVAARERIAKVAGHYLDRLRSVRDAPDDLRLDTARGYRRLAALQGLTGASNLGDPDQAVQSLAHAEVLLGPLLAARANDPAVWIEEGRLALARWTLKSSPDGPRENDRAARALARAMQLQPGNAEAVLGAVMADRNRAYDLELADDPKASLALLRPALARLRATRFTGELEDEAALVEVSLLTRIGDGIYYSGDIPGALVPYREGERLVLAHLAHAPSVRWEDKLAEARYNLSSTLGDCGRAAEGLAVAREGIARLRTVLASGEDAALRVRLMVLLGQESILLQSLGRTAVAADASREGIAIREARLAAHPAEPVRQHDLIVALAAHATILTDAGHRAEGCRAARRGIGLLDAMTRARTLGERDRRAEYPKLQAAAKRSCG